ncbi:ABC transporter substrate-binding protein [Maledivibacter halophilus]|uniref:NitT/TauT family transport system substrate-binding protein n=1 Tax=Maledivibacter halophilus TaxID=36842 RepID=A0A1T5MRD8_9FIRM|nr:ABC transporter substrate-binding protein [Maledivibacter halophilus]SKC90790.1 NitT/TauT family transport system substrate-binding protein [Maledivibacter halophilus]
MKRLLRTKGIYIFLIIFTTLFLFSGCASKKDISRNNEIKIAEQYGLAYAPIQIMKYKEILEKNLPEVEITWKQMGNTAAIREGMISNQVDVGFMAIPPFMIGWDKGMDWKIASGLSSMPVGLVTYKNDIKSIEDFTIDDRIALPQPGSIQHILLSMASEKTFNDASKLDNLLVTMAHPDGMNALLARKDITAHFTSPPYIFKELENEGFHQILTGEEAMGKDFTFIVGVSTKEFHDKNPNTYKAFVKSLHEAIDFINANPQEAADILADEYNLPKEEVLSYITADGTVYSSSVKGLKDFADFMKRNNYLSKSFENANEILWEDVRYEK